ncbi:MAG: UbiA prenyltransferase family protein [Halorientalis sp.]
MLAVPFAALLYGELYHGAGVAFLAESLVRVVLASVSLFLIHSGSQSLNMSEDAHMDEQTDHKSDRPIPSGRVSREGARSLAWMTVLGGLALAFAVTTVFGTFAVVLAGFGIWYNLGPIRAKEVLWLNLVWQATSRGLLLYPTAFAVFGDPFDPVAWGLGAVAFLLVLSMQNTADFSDVETDGKFGVTTPAVYHGLRTLVAIMAVIAVVMFLALSVLIYLDVLPTLWALALLALPIFWSLWNLWTGPNDVSSLGGNHSSWYVYYLCLASMYVLPPLQLLALRP